MNIWDGDWKTSAFNAVTFGNVKNCVKIWKKTFETANDILTQTKLPGMNVNMLLIDDEHI